MPKKPSRKETILTTVADLVADFLYYDRKEDDELPRGAIEDALDKCELSVADIVEHFESKLRAGL